MLTATGGFVEIWPGIMGTTGAEVADSLKPYPRLRGAGGLKQTESGRAMAGPADLVVREPDGEGVIRTSVGTEFPTNPTLAEYWARQRDFVDVVEVDERQPRLPHPHLVGYALPEIAGAPSPSPLMLWWALLIGLSSLARYESAAWTAAIDLDASDLAVGLERVLDIAAERVPQRILTSLHDPV